MECVNHPGIAAVERCDCCAEPFCYDCLVEIDGRHYCAVCKEMPLGGRVRPPIVRHRSATCNEALVALIFAFGGLFLSVFSRLGILLEIAALVMALMARSRISANPRLTGSGMATAAMVIACIVLALYVLVALALISFVVAGSGFQ